MFSSLALAFPMVDPVIFPLAPSRYGGTRWPIWWEYWAAGGMLPSFCPALRV